MSIIPYNLYDTFFHNLQNITGFIVVFNISLIEILRSLYVTDTNAVITWQMTPVNRSDLILLEVKEFNFGSGDPWKDHLRFEVSASRTKINIPQLHPGVRFNIL